MLGGIRSVYLCTWYVSLSRPSKFSIYEKRAHGVREDMYGSTEWQPQGCQMRCRRSCERGKLSIGSGRLDRNPTVRGTQAVSTILSEIQATTRIPMMPGISS